MVRVWWFWLFWYWENGVDGVGCEVGGEDNRCVVFELVVVLVVVLVLWDYFKDIIFCFL